MSQENVELVRESVRRFAAGDLSGLADLYTPDVVVVAPPRWPEGGRFEGRDAVIRQLARVQEDWDHQTMEVRAKNLAENAIRYAGPGATFTLAVYRSADAVVLSGRDDGIGLDESELPRLFERFYRADRARASRGTGLGLAIVKHIVTQAGGTVEARGARGRGLEVRCELPAP